MNGVRGRIVALAAVVAAVALPHLLDSMYLIGLLHLALVYALLTLGFNFTQGISGRTSLGHVGFWAIGAYASGVLTGRAGWPPVLAMAVGVALAVVFAVVLAALTNGLQAFYLALATLGFGQIVQVVAINWTDVTQGSNGIAGVPPVALGPFHVNTPVRQYYVLLVLVLLGAWFTARFIASKPGRDAFAMRQSPVAAESLGIDTRALKTSTLVISAVYASVAGSMYAHVYGYISPDVFSFSTMLLILAMLVVGGQGTVWGPVVGAIVVTLLPEALRVSDRYWMLLYGVGLFLVMMRMPGGIVGLVTRRGPGRRASRPGDEPPSEATRPAAERSGT